MQQRYQERQPYKRHQATLNIIDSDLDYNLHILTIYLDVKFSCTMKIQHGTQILTGNIATNTNSNTSVNISKTSKTQQQKKKFIVNGQIQLKSTRGSDSFEITLHLQTDKGGNYFAGVIKLKKQELLEIGKEVISLKIQKCLDPEAYCEAKVQKVQRKKQSSVSSDPKVQKLTSPRSQVRTDNTKKPISSFYGSPKNIDYQSKIGASILKTVAVENTLQEVSEKPKETVHLQEENSNKSSRIFKNQKQSSNQTLRQNTSRIKQLQLQINNLVTEKPEKAVIDQLLKQKAEKMTKLQDKIKTLTSEKEQLLKQIQERQNQHKKQLQLLKKSISKNPSLKAEMIEMTKKFTNLEETNKNYLGRLEELTRKLNKMQQELKEREKQYKQDLQKKEKFYKENIQILNENIRKLTLKNTELQQIIESLEQENKNQATSKTSIEQQNTILTEQIRRLLDQLEKYKQNASKIQKNSLQAKIEEDYIKIGQGLTKIVQCDNCKEFQQLLENQQRRNLDLQKTSNELFDKNLELEKQLAMIKLQDQRNKFQVEQWKEQSNQLKEKQKALKEQMRDMEEQINSLQTRLEAQRQKYELKDLKQQSLRQESNEAKTSSTKLRESYQQLQLAHAQILKQRDSVAFQCEKLKMKYKVLEQKIQTISNDNRQRQNTSNQKISKYQKEVITLKSKINSMMSNGQDLNQRIHSKELQNLKYQIEVENYQNQLSDLKDRLERAQFSLRQKEDQIYELQSSLKQKDLRMEHLKQDIGSARVKYTELSTHLNSNSKMIEMAESQTKMYKNELQQLKQLLQEKKKQQIILKQNIALMQDQQVKITRSYSNLQFEFVQYKNNVLDTFLTIPVFEHGREDMSDHHDNHQFQDQDQSLIMDLPITHFTINEDTPLSNIKKYLAKYIEENAKNNSLLMEQNQNLSGQNKDITEQFAKIAQDLHKKQQMLNSARKQFAEQTQQLKNKLASETKIYEQNLKNMKKDLNRVKTQFQAKGKELQQVKSSKQQQKKNHEASFSDLVIKYQQKINHLKSNLEQMQATVQFINLKNNSILENKKSSEKQIDLLRKQLKNQKAQNDKKTKQVTEISAQLSKAKSELQANKTYKSETTKQLKELQLQLQLIKTKSLEKIDRLQQSIKTKQKTISEHKSKIESFYKQKQLSTKTDYEKDNKILILQQKLNRLENQKDELTKKLDNINLKYNEIRQSAKQITIQSKEKQKIIKQLHIKQQLMADSQQKLQKLIDQKDSHITKLEERNLEQIQEFNKKKNQMLNNLQEESQKSVKAIGQKNLIIIQLQNSLNKLTFEQKRTQEINHSLQQEIYVERHKLMERDSEVQTLTARRDQLQQRQQQLQSMYCKLAEQTRQKQQKLFSLSSRVYQLETKLNQAQKNSKQSIDVVNARWEAKLKKITDEFQAKLSVFDGRPKIQSFYERQNLLNKSKQKNQVPERDQSPIRQIQTYFEQRNQQLKSQKATQSLHEKYQKPQRLQKNRLSEVDDIFSKNLASLKPNYFKRTAEPKSINYRRIQRFRSEFE